MEFVGEWGLEVNRDFLFSNSKEKFYEISVRSLTHICKTSKTKPNCSNESCAECCISFLHTLMQCIAHDKSFRLENVLEYLVTRRFRGGCEYHKLFSTIYAVLLVSCQHCSDHLIKYKTCPRCLALAAVEHVFSKERNLEYVNANMQDKSLASKIDRLYKFDEKLSVDIIEKYRCLISSVI